MTKFARVRGGFSFTWGRRRYDSRRDLVGARLASKFARTPLSSLGEPMATLTAANRRPSHSQVRASSRGILFFSLRETVATRAGIESEVALDLSSREIARTPIFALE